MNTLRSMCGSLEDDGWASVSMIASTQEGFAAELKLLASALGEIAPGRGGRPVEPILPESVETARPGSLSSKYGLRPLPLHTDTAHWNVPCRYLLLACVDPGSVPTPTILLDSRSVQLSDSERLACRSAPFVVRNGRFSFYGTIMDRDRPFIRLDPGCMKALSNDGADALAAFSLERQAKSLLQHYWKRGDVLLFDNWRILHARGYDAPTEPGRILFRIMIR
jgi:Taurine catabolism dioxygenase TauD, TfdA family